MENMLTAHPNLRAIYSTTDQDATGIRQALAAANRDVVFVAHDASREAATAILQGDYLDADIANPSRRSGTRRCRLPPSCSTASRSSRRS